MEKEKNAGNSQPHLQRKRDRYVRKGQDLRQRTQEADKKKQEYDEIRREMVEIQQEIKWMQKEIEEEFPYLRGLEVKENAVHPMLEIEQPTSVVNPIF